MQMNFRTYFDKCTISKKAAQTESHRDNLNNYVRRRQAHDRHLVRIEPAKFNTETFHARLLIMQFDCLATTWEELRTVDGDLCDTFAEAARKRGLLDDEHTASMVMTEALASELTTPRRARALLVMVRR